MGVALRMKAPGDSGKPGVDHATSCSGWPSEEPSTVREKAGMSMGVELEGVQAEDAGRAEVRRGRRKRRRGRVFRVYIFSLGVACLGV